MKKSKIGPLQPILATKRYVSFFLGHPVLGGLAAPQAPQVAHDINPQYLRPGGSDIKYMIVGW